MMNMLSKGKCNNKSKEEDSNFLKIQTCVLKVNIHCDGCKRKVKKLLQKIDGVYTVTVDVEQKKVSVSGNVDPDTLIRKLVKNGKHAELLSPKPFGGGRNNQFQKQLQVDNAAKAGQKGGGGKKQVPVMKQLQPQQTKGFNLKMPGFIKNPNSVKFDVPEDDEDVWSDFDDGDVFDELDELEGGFDDDFEVDLKPMKNVKPMKGDGGQKKDAAANYSNKMKPPLQRGGGAFPAGMNMMPPQRSGGNGNGGGGNVSMNPVMSHTKKGDGQKKGALVGGKKGGDVGGKKSGKNSGGGAGGGRDREGKSDTGGGGNKNPQAGTPFQMSAGSGGVGGPFQNPSGMNVMAPQRFGNGNGASGGGNVSMHPSMNHMRNGGPMSGQPPELFSGGGNPYQQQQYLAAMMQQQQQQQQQQQRMMMMNGGGSGSMAYSRAPPPVAAAVNYMNPPPDFTHVFSDENTNSCSIM